MHKIKYIGVKIVEATPMTREEFEAEEGRNLRHGLQFAKIC